MTVVGIDVSKGKSMVAAMKPGGELVAAPYEVRHSDIELSRLALDVLCMEPDTRVVMEATGRYHEPVAALLHSEGIFVSILNPLLIKQSGAGSLRKVKSDPKDALKIAKYGLDNWSTLREYTPTEAIRQQLKLCERQCDLYSKNIVMLTNNLISLSDKTFPGVNELFSSPEKADGHLKWVDFYRTFWHCDCINRMSPDAFGERYKNGARERATILVLMRQMLSTQPAADFTPRCRVTTMPSYWLRLPPTSLLHCAKTSPSWKPRC